MHMIGIYLAGYICFIYVVWIVIVTWSLFNYKIEVKVHQLALWSDVGEGSGYLFCAYELYVISLYK